MPVVLMSVLRFLIALVQMAGLIAYFHQYHEWPLLPTAIVALALTLLAPIVATIFGFMGAVYAWSWPWWLAFLVFLPGLTLALTAVAGVGILGMLSAFLLKRFGIKLATRGTAGGAGRASPHTAEPSAAGRGDTIEGEVLSSRVDTDTK